MVGHNIERGEGPIFFFEEGINVDQGLYRICLQRSCSGVQREYPWDSKMGLPLNRKSGPGFFHDV
ncbi:Hypothetical protein FKW44_017032 [Caligus rogercresseyi]|uniref:Uncharacterized protein n=1 Tax=Caligus rogercresseyi TaxID=217165 RepID=A0A7T8K1M1_CALRO|nr:Hypothetical protein FKW44_017032 [Caligus rogercresseyi]